MFFDTTAKDSFLKALATNKILPGDDMRKKFELRSRSPESYVKKLIITPDSSEILGGEDEMYSPLIGKKIASTGSILHQVLSETPVERRKELAQHAANIAADTLGGSAAYLRETKWHEQGYGRHRKYETVDRIVTNNINAKLRICAYHGADLIEALKHSSSTARAKRVMEIAASEGQALTLEAAQHVADLFTKNSNRDPETICALGEVLLAGAKFTKDVELATFWGNVINTKDPLALAIYLDHRGTGEEVSKDDRFFVQGPIRTDHFDTLYERAKAAGQPINDHELFYAAAKSRENFKAVEKLVALGLDINAQDAKGNTAYHRIVAERHTSLDFHGWEESLLKAGASATITNKYGMVADQEPKKPYDFDQVHCHTLDVYEGKQIRGTGKYTQMWQHGHTFETRYHAMGIWL